MDAKKQQNNNKNDAQREEKAVKRLVKMKIPEILRKKIKVQKELEEDGAVDTWKPIKLQTIKANQQAQQQAATQLRATNGLKGKVLRLPPPKNTTTDQQPKRPENSYRPKPQVNVEKPTEEQLKWDIYDQSFIKKEFMHKKLQQEEAAMADGGKFKEYNQEDEIDEAEIPEDFKGKAITTTINKESLLDIEWRKKEIERRTRMAVWEEAATKVTAVDKSKNQINALLEDAMRRAEETEFDMNKKVQQRRNMKSRYGW